MSLLSSDLQKRYTNNCYYDEFGRYYCQNSGWYNWGRWLLLGLAIAVFLLFLFLMWCASYRRRRRGARPFYGTGWMTSNIQPGQHYQSGYNRPAPPPPGQQYGGGYGYAPQQEQGGYAPRQPEQAYRGGKGGDGYYEPPVGPPPDRVY